MNAKDSFSGHKRFFDALRAEAEGSGSNKSSIIFEEVGPRLAKSPHVRKKDPKFKQWFQFMLAERKGE